MQGAEVTPVDWQEELAALANARELGDDATTALRGLIHLADWREPNFVPKANSSNAMRAQESRKDSGRVAVNMVAESLAGLEFDQVRTSQQLADIGSGAGFPGLVLAIALPRTRVALIEKREETCGFLRRAVAELGLDNVRVVNTRGQQWSDGLGTCDVVTSRNAAAPEAIVRIGAPLLNPRGAVVVWQKRRDPEKEALAAAAADQVGLRLSQVHRSEYRHQDGVKVRHLFLYSAAPYSDSAAAS